MKLFNGFREYIFPNLFPRYFKDYDTYKHNEVAPGVGILERFIQVLGEYFDTHVTPKIKNTLDNIDVDVADDIFLNYIWEMFGKIPYAYGVVASGDTFSEENYEAWKEQTLKVFPKANARLALKYAVRLLQIRGTNTFFQLLGSFYGLTVEIVPEGEEDVIFSDGNWDMLIGAMYDEPNGKEFWDKKSTIPVEDKPFVKCTWAADTDKALVMLYRKPGSLCKGCTRVNFTVRLPWAKYLSLTKDQLEAARQVYEKIFIKYLPVDIEMANLTLLPQYPPIITPKELWVESSDGSLMPDVPLKEPVEPVSGETLEIYKNS